MLQNTITIQLNGVSALVVLVEATSLEYTRLIPDFYPQDIEMSYHTTGTTVHTEATSLEYIRLSVSLNILFPYLADEKWVECAGNVEK
jgi:hypothetical protein